MRCFGPKAKRKREKQSLRWIPIPFVPQRFKFIAPISFEECIKLLRIADTSSYGSQSSADVIIDLYPITKTFSEFHFETIYKRPANPRPTIWTDYDRRTVNANGNMEIDGNVQYLDFVSTMVTGTVRWRSPFGKIGGIALILSVVIYILIISTNKAVFAIILPYGPIGMLAVLAHDYFQKAGMVRRLKLILKAIPGTYR